MPALRFLPEILPRNTPVRMTRADCAVDFQHRCWCRDWLSATFRRPWLTVLVLTPDMINADLWGFFHAGHIATDIKGAVTVGQSEDGSTAYSRLAEQRFDQAPVVFQGRIAGWVLASQLSGRDTVASVMTPLDNSAIVSAESSIASVLQLLGRHNFVFTADKDGLAGFIVPSDLDRHAARSYFFLLVAGIEMLLSEIVRSTISEEKLVLIIDRSLRKRYQQAHHANSEAHAVEYLYIRQLVDLFLATPYAKDPHLWDESLTQQLLAVREFRKSVMHPTCSIAATTPPSRAAELAAWTEGIAERLRQIVVMLRAHQFDRR